MRRSRPWRLPGCICRILLAGLTFLGALAWCWMYEHHPNVLPLALSHAVLTVAILYAFDDRITGRLRVGAAYFSSR